VAKWLCDPSEWTDAPVVFDQAAVLERIPHRHNMALLNGLLHHEPQGALSIGWHDSTDQDFWVAGHIPGRPVMPGIVMLEASAQLCSFMSKEFIKMGPDQMFGFGGINAVRFRGSVGPGERLLIASSLTKVRSPVAIYRTEAYAKGELVYQGEVVGVAF